jgi:trehalose 6-phosphate phosphatase
MSQTDEKTSRLVDKCLWVLSAKPAAFATDIDGTISPIAATPESAFVIPAAIEALEALNARLDVVFILTGRTALDAEQMIHIPGILYIGNHGLERRSKGKSSDNITAMESIEAIRNALVDVKREIQAQEITDGILIEDKKLTASIHYRLSPARERIGPALGAIIHGAALQHGLRMTEGRFVFELRPQVAVNKGSAAFDVIREQGLKGIVFLGDDVTDIDAFRAIRQSRHDGIVRGLSIAVNSPETKSVVLEEADDVVEGVNSAVKLMQELAARLAHEIPQPRQ